MPGHVRIQRFASRPQVVRALLLPEHPKLNIVDWNEIISGIGLTRATEIANQLRELDLNPWPGTWLLLEGTDVVGWASSMDDMDPL